MADATIKDWWDAYEFAKRQGVTNATASAWADAVLGADTAQIATDRQAFGRWFNDEVDSMLALL